MVLDAQNRESRKLARSCKYVQLSTETGDGYMEKPKKAGVGLAPVMGTWVSGKVIGHDQISAKTGDGSKEMTMKTRDGLVQAMGT